MKHIFSSLLSLLLALCMLAGCTGAPSDTDKDGDSPAPGTTAPDGRYIVTEKYLPEAFAAQMKSYFEGSVAGFYPYDDRANAPLVSTDVFAISNCTVKSITIPVFSTGKVDREGNFTFSIYILSNKWGTLRTEIADPDAPITVKINAEEHGLEQDKVVRKFIKVDLSGYNIVLSADETLGFSHKDDTLIPARVITHGSVDNLKKEKYAPAKYMIDNLDAVGYYYYDSAKETFSYTDNSLLFDFELERTYESKVAYDTMIAEKNAADAAYAEKLAAVKAAYAGKYISVMGDSISTFNGVSDDEALGLGDNPAYSKYTLTGAVYTPERTYWGKLAAETDMELCVINSWGGGKVYGWPSKYAGKDCMLLRSYNLARDGQSPDLILLNFGINDMGSSYSSIQDSGSSSFTGKLPTGDLYQRLTATNKSKTNKEIVAEWFAEVEQKAAQGGFDPADPNTITFNSSGKSDIYVCWEAAYALSLQNIKRLYGNAEIFCITLPDRNHTSSTQPRLSRANLIIQALAEYFEVGFVDQSKSGISRENCIMYASDATGLHPNGKGHAALTKVIVEALYEKLHK